MITLIFSLLGFPHGFLVIIYYGANFLTELLSGVFHSGKVCLLPAYLWQGGVKWGKSIVG